MTIQLDWAKALRNRFADISGVDFEYYLAELFRTKGYSVKLTSTSGDYGVDLIISNDENKVAVQAKRNGEENHVGVVAIHHLASGAKHYSCSACLFVTTSSFTDAADKAAQEHHVILWDWPKLKSEIIKAKAQLINPNDDTNVSRTYINGSFDTEIREILGNARSSHISDRDEIPPAASNASDIDSDCPVQLAPPSSATSMGSLTPKPPYPTWSSGGSEFSPTARKWRADPAEDQDPPAPRYRWAPSTATGCAFPALFSGCGYQIYYFLATGGCMLPAVALMLLLLWIARELLRAVR